jgi:phage-related protein
MASNIAAAATRVGMSESEILGLAATLSSLGLDKGGASAISRVMTEIDMAIATNSDELKTWANTANMSVKEFSALWTSDATAGLGAFIQGLADAKGEGENLNKLLDDLGITELRQIDTISRLTNASEQLATYTDMSTKAYADNTALSEEAEKRYQTLESRIQVVKNKITEFALEIGEQLMPVLDKVVSFISNWADRLNNLSESEKYAITVTSALFAVITPLLSFIAGLVIKFGNLSTAIGGVLKNEKVATFLGKLVSNGTSLSKVLATLFKTVKSLINPITAILAIVGVAYATNEDFRNGVNELVTTLWNMLAPVLKNVWELFKQLWGVIKTVWDIVVAIINVFTDLFVVFKDTSAFDVLVILFQLVLDIINQVIEAVKTLIGWVQSLIGWVRDALNWLGDLIGKQNDAVASQYSATTGRRGEVVNSGGYGALNSGGFTLNASFNVNTPYAPTRADVHQWSGWLVDEINEGLGRRIK